MPSFPRTRILLKTNFSLSYNQGATGSSVYSIPNAELLLSLDLSVVEFPRENLRFVEVLGEGQFGEVSVK
ncbi:hypothetical protein DPMN_070260 [Dreissena polymorpha]|uniref:Protein kinase domain-containing protein n=1 Tax=Dreissena polymorpha TaxID=45954 RepID=A0A9D4BUZ7_DREPO|nr:hypothetical protein DPMN_070260 [Dreissena polymorpha]